MLLRDLLLAFDPTMVRRDLPETEIKGVREDSRRVQPGDVLVVRPGEARFVKDAIARGAAAIATQEPLGDCPVPQIGVGDAIAAAGRLANLFHGDPSVQVKVLGVTGTHGKTTTTYLLRHLLGQTGRRCGLIGTVQVDDGRTTRQSPMTTPSVTDLIQLLATMRDNGCSACALSAPCHAMERGRLTGVRIGGAAFTNLIGNPLDYHGTTESHAASKAKLFEQLDALGVAAVNQEDPWSKRLVRGCRGRIILFGLTPKADYWAKDLVLTAQGSRFVLVTPEGKATVKTGLIGRHNIRNVLPAAALAGEVFGLSVHEIASALFNAEGAPGRLQAVGSEQPFAVLVDGAHTAEALQNVLSALRPITSGKLRVLFGCGGDRDPTKRPRMARAVEKLADAIYVTSDNPRTEDPSRIVAEIVAGLTMEGRQMLHVEIDRRAAIEQALWDAGSGDVVLLAGKGHSTRQIIGTETLYFNDVEEATRVLRQMSGVRGP